MGESVQRRSGIYLDGLDETPDISKQWQLLRLAREIKQLEPSTQIIVTGREHVAGSHLNGLSRLHVGEFNETQLNELFDQWFVNSAERKGAFKKQIALLPSLKLVMKSSVIGNIGIERV
jgi:hypothetical protein